MSGEVSRASRLAIALVEAGVDAKAAIAFSQSDTAKELLESHAPSVSAPIVRGTESPFGPVGETREFFDRLRTQLDARNAKRQVPDANEILTRMAGAPIGRSG